MPFEQCTEAEVEFAELLERATSRRIGTVSHQNEPEPGSMASIVGHLSLLELMQFALFIGAPYGKGHRMRGVALHRHKNSGQMRQLVRRAADVLSNWPNRFHEHLASSQGRKTNLANVSKFDNVFNYVRYILAGENFQFARDELNVFIRTKWNKGFIQSSSWRYAHADDSSVPYMSAKAAAIRLGVTHPWIKKGVTEGTIPGLIRPHGNRGMTFVERSWVDEMASHRERVQKAALLESSLKRAVRNNLIPLHRGFWLNAPDIIRAVSSGELRIYRRGGNRSVQAFSIIRDDACAVKMELVAISGDFLSYERASSMLQIPRKRLRAMVAKGILRSNKNEHGRCVPGKALYRQDIVAMLKGVPSGLPANEAPVSA
jgi:hypothetical protein